MHCQKITKQHDAAPLFIRQLELINFLSFHKVPLVPPNFVDKCIDILVLISGANQLQVVGHTGLVDSAHEVMM
jgi:hypothetical protein